MDNLKLFINFEDIEIPEGNYDIEIIDLKRSYDEWQHDKFQIQLADNKFLLFTPTCKYKSKFKPT